MPRIGSGSGSGSGGGIDGGIVGGVVLVADLECSW